MKTYARWLLFAALVVSLIANAILAVFYVIPRWNWGEPATVQMQEYTSPDNAYTARVYFHADQFAQGLFLCWVIVDRAGSSDRAMVLRLKSSTAVDCEWKDDKTLVVKYVGHLDTDDHYWDMVGDVRVQRKELKVMGDDTAFQFRMGKVLR